MVEKRNRNATVFHGCNQFPDCRHSEDAPTQATTHLHRGA
ncbi:hypothetical protein NKH19_31090 [Mesorhizobium sp. M1338]